jgi:hypothetical protein
MEDKDKHFNTQQKVEVGETKVDSVLLTLGGGATIRGRLVAANGAANPSRRNNVLLQSTSDDDEAGFAYAEVTKDGTFELDSVADGSYAVMVGGLEQGWFMKSAHLGSQDVLQNGVQVEKGATAGTLEILISSDGAQLEGTVTDGDKNQPLAGVQVKARADPENDYNDFRSCQAQTDQNGHFVIKDVPPGKYTVSAKIPSSGAGAPAVKSDPVAVTLGDREHRALDFKITVPKSE